MGSRHHRCISFPASQSTPRSNPSPVSALLGTICQGCCLMSSSRSACKFDAPHCTCDCKALRLYHGLHRVVYHHHNNYIMP